MLTSVGFLYPRTNPSSHAIYISIHWGCNKMPAISQTVFSSNVPETYFQWWNHKLALVWIMVCHQTSHSPSSEPVMTYMRHSSSWCWHRLLLCWMIIINRRKICWASIQYKDIILSVKDTPLCLVSTLGFLMLVRWHPSFIETGRWLFRAFCLSICCWSSTTYYVAPFS